jgi:hypothetical protein
MAGIWGLIFGRSSARVASTFPTRPALPGEHFNDLLQQHLAVRTFPLGVGIREMPSDIAQRGRAKERIADGVDKHIGIAVTERPFFVIDADATEPERTAFHQAVRVVAEPNAEGHSSVSFFFWSLLNLKPRLKRSVLASGLWFVLAIR